MSDLPKPAVYYVWREFRTPERESKPRLLIPWCNPREHEQSFDLMFDTPAEAIETKEGDDWGESNTEDWILCKLTVEPVGRHQGEAKSDD